MESLFNIAWAFSGAIGIAAGFVFRWRIASWASRDLVRDLVLLCLIIFLLFPVFSISDDIGYFSYYLSRGEVHNSAFWVSGARREKPFLSLVVAQAFALLLVSAPGALCQHTVLGRIALRGPAPLDSKRVAATYLRAPPSSV